MQQKDNTITYIWYCKNFKGRTSHLIFNSWSSPLLLTPSSTHTPGIYLSLNGIVHVNNSAFNITEIGTSFEDPLMNALQCITDCNRPCCITEGEWHYPNGTQICAFNDSQPELSTDFYTQRGNANRAVNLFRRTTDITSPIGSYCCETMVDADMSGTVCANIGKLYKLDRKMK